MGVRFSILASGSTGNSMIVETREHRILIDAGLSMKKIEQLLQERQTKLNEIDAVFITHEHSDHIKGLGALARKLRLPVYANSRTWAELEKLVGDIAKEQVRIMETGERIQFGALTVESFAISHDAAEPVGYCFYEKDLKISLATDLGYMSPKVKEKIADSDALILEANHDVEMLRIGHYPWNIKRRILSDTGHLSNEAAGEALSELISSKTRGVYLAHLSRDHNLLDLARLTVRNILEENGILNKHRQVQLMDTYFDRPTKWEVVGEV
ncbi:MBL fold metallo-hydrolase [Ferviditalea candida]|uniref:MBL fold metallo-hydrolase n=1 Tax=Ferviditalea candida TaxID=3108399 RepID=A0ABU5ZL30_9BACL|nr:MBL fold metallo-hydrolase [Paenibacillaceae bacterium T2]